MIPGQRQKVVDVLPHIVCPQCGCHQMVAFLLPVAASFSEVRFYT